MFSVSLLCRQPRTSITLKRSYRPILGIMNTPTGISIWADFVTCLRVPRRREGRGRGIAGPCWCCGAHTDRFQSVKDVVEPATSTTEPRNVRSRPALERVEAACPSGMEVGVGSDAGVLEARVAGLEEEGIFRSVVTFL